MGTQKDKWLILTAGDLEVALKDEHDVDRQGKGLSLFTMAAATAKRQQQFFKQFSYTRATRVSIHRFFFFFGRGTIH